MYRSLALPGAALLLALAGCAPAPTTPTGPDRAALERPAKALLAQGSYREAAQAYLSLAKAGPPELAAEFVLSAGDALLEGGDLDAGRRLVEQGVAGALPPRLETYRSALRARIALEEGRPTDALALVPEFPPAGLPLDLRARMGRVRVDALEAAGHASSAIRERVQLDIVLTEERHLRANRRALWNAVRELPPGELAQRAPPPDTLSGWLELAQIAQAAAIDPGIFDREIEGWRTRYPGHPAGEFVVPEVAESVRSGAGPVAHVALLLPFDGPFRNAAQAIRDGFLTAWFADRRNERRPTVSLHDTAGVDVWRAYESALAAGADFVVGPLERESVEALAASESLPVTTLALNFAAPPAPAGEATPARAAPAGLYQFALSPEQEARRVAERARADGRTTAGVLVPEGDWGNRVGQAFSEAWTGLGGIVAEVQAYPGDAPDMSEPVKRLLNIDESQARYQALRGTLGGGIEFEPSPRSDIDFVFMGAFPLQARRLRPQLAFNHAADVPVYATSHAYTGTPDPGADVDIEGVVIGDMPWVLDGEAPEVGLRYVVESAWPDSVRARLRLYAFGADAYRIVPRLARLRLDPQATLAGATGVLGVDSRNRVQRSLDWARFVEGVPQLIEPESGAAQ